MMYGGFAAVYDELMADVDYNRWAQYYLQLAERAHVQVVRAADCACGTGSLTLELARRGIAMTGLDQSLAMLQVAGNKARQRGLGVPFVRQDMRKLLLHRPVDAVISACDGVNYLVRPDDVRAFFRGAYAALRPGGCLLFDISTHHKLANLLADRCLGEDGDRVTYLWQNHFEPRARMLQMDLTFFVKEADGRYARFAETHFQRAHTIDEIGDWLYECGFDPVIVYGDRDFSRPTESTCRVHFAAVRPVGGGSE